ncbi:MAG: RHS repeat-associated core domain-containing protein, partial [Terriglobia bacterium]
GNVLAESDISGNIKDEYVFFGGKRIARVDSSGKAEYYLPDALGSSRVITDANGAILDDCDFLPFGDEQCVTSSSGNNYKFTGKERDNESGNDYFSARSYASQYSRFTSPDPENVGADSSNPQTWNAYTYAGNNPTTFTDPTGETYEVCQTDDNGTKINCATISDEQFDQFEGENSKTLSFTGSGEIAQGGTEIGTYKQTSVDLSPEAALILHSAGVSASTQIKGFVRDVGIAAALGPVLGLASIPEEGAGEEGAASFVETVSARNLKHIAQHLPEFQELDPSATVEDLVRIGKDVARTGNRTGALTFEKTVQIGGIEVKVRAVLNAVGRLRTVYIVR